jgi:hypothetical protein
MLKKYLIEVNTSIKTNIYAVYKYGVKGRSPLWGPGAKPLVGSKGEALVGAADCCIVLLFTFYNSTLVENGARN